MLQLPPINNARCHFRQSSASHSTSNKAKDIFANLKTFAEESKNQFDNLSLASFSTECSDPNFMRPTTSARRKLMRNDSPAWQSDLRTYNTQLSAKAVTPRKQTVKKGDILTESSKKPQRFKVGGLYKTGKIVICETEKQYY